jgi:hypothetical protein
MLDPKKKMIFFKKIKIKLKYITYEMGINYGSKFLSSK